MFDKMKFSLNKGVLWLKILYTMYAFGICIILPFFTLQMASLGLDEVDISYINGIIPIIVTISTPIIGFLSDKIGYKSVLIGDILVICLSTTSYILIPGYQEVKSPLVNITNDTSEFSDNDGSTFIGNHSQTFWLVFGLQTIITIACNVGWTMWDTISITEAVRHNSNYPAILIWALAGQAVAPFISAWTIEDGANGVNNYSMAYFSNDAVMFVIVILLLWKLKLPKKETQSNDEEKVSFKEALKQMLSVPMLISLIGIGTTGFIYGVQTTYLYLYLQRDLKASSELISYMNNIAYGCQAAFLLFADYAVAKVGCVNSIAINIFLDAIKLLIYAYIEQKPPYFALGLHVLNFTFVGFSWVAILKYAYRITPPQLTGTIVGIVMVFCAQICNSVAGLGGGQLLQHLDWSIQDIFRLTAVIGFAGGIIYLLAYFMIGRKYEKILVEQLDKQYPDRWSSDKETEQKKEIYTISDQENTAF